MNSPVLQSTLRQMHAILFRPRLWWVFAVVVALFAVTGPFGTYGHLPFHSRLGYWLAVQAVAFLLAIGFATLFNVILEDLLAASLVRMLAGAAFAALPIALAVTLLNNAFLAADVSLAEYGGNFLTSLPVSMALCLLVWLTLEQETAPPEAFGITAEITMAHPPAATPAPRAALIDRLPPGKRGALLRLEVQDHYVLAVTTRGREMLLMRLADAMAETGTDLGMQVHRSHWVAFDAVKGIEREPGSTPRLVLELSDGTKVPVSRSFSAAVRARFVESPHRT